MYKFTNDLNYLNASEIPKFEYLKIGRDNFYNMDILTKEEKKKEKIEKLFERYTKIIMEETLEIIPKTSLLTTQVRANS